MRWYERGEDGRGGERRRKVDNMREDRRRKVDCMRDEGREREQEEV